MKSCLPSSAPYSSLTSSPFPSHVAVSSRLYYCMLLGASSGITHLRRPKPSDFLCPDPVLSYPPHVSTLSRAAAAEAAEAPAAVARARGGLRGVLSSTETGGEVDIQETGSKQPVRWPANTYASLCLELYRFGPRCGEHEQIIGAGRGGAVPGRQATLEDALRVVRSRVGSIERQGGGDSFRRRIPRERPGRGGERREGGREGASRLLD